MKSKKAGIPFAGHVPIAIRAAEGLMPDREAWSICSERRFWLLEQGRETADFRHAGENLGPSAGERNAGNV